MLRSPLLLLALVLVGLQADVASAATQPLGVVGTTLGRFDRDTLSPVPPALEVAEPHTGPALAPGGLRLALGVSDPGSPATPGTGRVGLWIVDARRMSIVREVRTGIAAEAVVYPGVVGALLQSGRLVVVDPDNGRILSRRTVGYSACAPPAVQAGGRGVILNEIHAGSVEVVVVEPDGAVHTLSVALDTSAPRCRQAALVASGNRVYLVGRDRVVTLNPITRRTSTRRIGGLGRDRTAAAVPGGLAVASERGLRVFNPTTGKVRWRDSGARSVLASGSIVVASGGGVVRALNASNGTRRWRVRARPAAAVAASRVYAPNVVLDLRTGKRRGTYPAVNTALRLR